MRAEAERLPREAVAVASRPTCSIIWALAYADLAEVLEVAGRLDDAAEAFEQARVRFEQKESLAGAARVRQRLEVLRAA
jgi:hypothetical protein